VSSRHVGQVDCVDEGRWARQAFGGGLTNVRAGLDHAALSQRIPLGRLGKPEEIASAALFLAQNEYAHNCVINLDGGLSAV
jgi:NAD(P)-dependent dehydrogenase (short-subunit alcohol dehydrogenase family)